MESAATGGAAHPPGACDPPQNCGGYMSLVGQWEEAKFPAGINLVQTMAPGWRQIVSEVALDLITIPVVSALSDPSMAAAAVNQRGKESRMSTVRRTRTELKRTTSVQLSRGSREAEIGARPGLEGEVADLEVELEAVEERVSRLMNLIEEKMPLYKQVGCWDIL